MSNLSLESSIRTCKVNSGWSQRLQSDRWLNPSSTVCPVWSQGNYGFDTQGRMVCRDSFNTKTAGCNSALDRITVENAQRPQYNEYVTLDAQGIGGYFGEKVPSFVTGYGLQDDERRLGTTEYNELSKMTSGNGQGMGAGYSIGGGNVPMNAQGGGVGRGYKQTRSLEGYTYGGQKKTLEGFEDLPNPRPMGLFMAGPNQITDNEMQRMDMLDGEQHLCGTTKQDMPYSPQAMALGQGFPRDAMMGAMSNDNAGDSIVPCGGNAYYSAENKGDKPLLATGVHRYTGQFGQATNFRSFIQSDCGLYAYESAQASIAQNRRESQNLQVAARSENYRLFSK